MHTHKEAKVPHIIDTNNCAYRNNNSEYRNNNSAYRNNNSEYRNNNIVYRIKLNSAQCYFEENVLFVGCSYSCQRWSYKWIGLHSERSVHRG